MAMPDAPVEVNEAAIEDDDDDDDDDDDVELAVMFILLYSSYFLDFHGLTIFIFNFEVYLCELCKYI